VSGMVYDLKSLKEVIRREVIEPFDHRFLNFEVEPFDRVVPTTENVAQEIWRRLEPQLASSRARLHSVRTRCLPNDGSGSAIEASAQDRQ